jgi:hypothetical protein
MLLAGLATSMTSAAALVAFMWSQRATSTGSSSQSTLLPPDVTSEGRYHRCTKTTLPPQKVLPTRSTNIQPTVALPRDSSMVEYESAAIAAAHDRIMGCERYLSLVLLLLVACVKSLLTKLIFTEVPTPVAFR